MAAALARIQTFLPERTLIRPAAAEKLEPTARRHRGAEAAEGEVGGQEAAAAAEEA